MVPRRTRLLAAATLVLVSVLWSLAGLLIKHIDWHPLAISGARSGIAAVLLLAVFGRPHLPRAGNEIGAAVSYALTVVLFVTATKLTTAANAILLQYTSPVFVALFAGWYLKERVSGVDWITIGAVLGGMSLFFLDKLDLSGFWGNICALLSGAAFAWVAIFFRSLKDQSSYSPLLFGNLLAFAAGIPFMDPSGLDTTAVLLLIVLGVVQLGLPYILYTWAVRHVTALDAILIPVLEPILNPLWVALFFGELPSEQAVIGGAVVLGAVLLRGAVKGVRRRKLVSTPMPA